jgi:hypothetical protein
MYKHLQYLNEECTMIRAVRLDDTECVIEPISGDFFHLVTGGAFGDVQPFVPRVEPPKAAEVDQMAAAFRRCMLATQAVLDGKKDLTNEEIHAMLQEINYGQI